MVINNPLLLLAPRVTDDSVAVWRAAISAGWSCQRLPGWRAPEHLKNLGAEIVIYAEPLFAEAVADQLGLLLLEPPADLLTTLPERFLQREVKIVALSEARNLEEPVFVKPADGKVFDPKVYSSGKALPEVEQIGDIPVLTSTPLPFALEVRFFVLDGAPVTASPYWRNDHLAQATDGTWPFLANEEGDSLSFACEVMNACADLFPPAFVLDVGLTELGWVVIEANPCWGAGLYGCAPILALQTARRAVVKAATADEQARRWVSKRNALKPSGGA